MHKKHKIFRLLTPAALTGICRSDGSADTLIREFIRITGCSPIQARIADSAACHSGPTNFLFSCSFFFLCIVCIFVANFFFASAARTSAISVSPCETLCFIISVHPCASVVPLLRVSLSQSAPICVNLRFQHFISFPEFQMPFLGGS
jgi:hypothetical protein